LSTWLVKIGPSPDKYFLKVISLTKCKAWSRFTKLIVNIRVHSGWAQNTENRNRTEKYRKPNRKIPNRNNSVPVRFPVLEYRIYRGISVNYRIYQGIYRRTEFGPS
jgi:hypothetical protein